MNTLIGKKGTFAITILVVVTMLAMIPPHIAVAADTTGDSGDIFSELGFDTSSTPQGYNADSTPFGRDNVSLNKVNELLVRDRTNWYLYGNDTPFGNATNTINPATPMNTYDTYLTASGDFTGSGKQNDVIVLGANTVLDPQSYDENNPTNERSDRGLYAFFVDPLTGIESSAKEIYNGTIGNDFELDGMLRYNPSNDNTSSSQQHDGYYNPAALQNYMQVVTGDFTGDGVDEIAIYNPNPTNPCIEIYQLQATGTDRSVWQNWENWHIIYTYSVSIKNINIMDVPNNVLVPNQLSLVVGDINYDGRDDLAVAYSYGNFKMQDGSSDNYYYSNEVFTNTGGNTPFEGKVVALLSGGPNTFIPVEVCTVGPDSVTQSGSYYYFTYSKPSLAFGDITGSGRDCLILTMSFFAYGADKAVFPDSTVQVSLCPYYNSTESFVISTSDKITPYQGDYTPIVNGNAVAFSPGPGQADNLFYEGSIYSVNADGDLELSGYDTSGLGVEYGLAAVDLDNDLIDEIVLTGSYVVRNNGNYTQGAAGFVLAQDGSNLTVQSPYGDTSVIFDSNGRLLPSTVIMATPDTDNDTMLLTYKSQHIMYTDPKVLAVMAGAPLYQSLENLNGGDSYVSNSGTSWSTSTGSGGGSTNSSQVSAGAYVSVEEDVSVFGVKLFSAEFEAEYKAMVTWETEQKSTVSETVEYGAMGYTDSVALYSLPVVVYVYDIQTPTDVYGKTVTTEYYYNVPFSPSVTVMTADEYEQVALNYSDILPSLRNGANPVLTHTQGDPSTYPTESEAKALSGVRIFSGNYSGVGFGSGRQTQTISIENEETRSTTFSNEFSFKAGAGAGGVKVGIIIGGGVGIGSLKITTSGSEFSGTVVNMPADAKQYGFNYNWKIMQYWYTLGNGDAFPVVSYVVQSNLGGIVPMAIPTNLSIDTTRTTTDSMTLTWSYPTGKTCTGFKVYRFNPITQTYEPIATVPYVFGQDSYSYTDTGLGWGAQYSYQVQAVRSNLVPTESVPSTPALGWTLVNNNIKLELSQYSLTAYPDKVYNIVSDLTTVQGAGSATYMWQKLLNGIWTDTQVNTKDLAIRNARPADAGEYRLYVSQQIGVVPSIIYSPVFTLTVEKRTASIQLTAIDNGSSLTMTAVLRNTATNLESGSIPAGSVSFEVTFMGMNTFVYTADTTIDAVSKTATATYTIQNAAEGLYEVKAIYAGNSVFKSGESYSVLHFIGSGSTIFAVAPTQLYYGDVFSPQFLITEKDGSNTTVSPLGSDYTVTLNSLEKQDPISPSNLIDATLDKDYTVSGTDISNIYLDSGVSSPLYTGDISFQYYATYEVVTPQGDTIYIDLDYVVNKRPVMVVPSISEIEQSMIGPIDSSYFTLVDPATGKTLDALPFGQTFDDLLTGYVTNGTTTVNWNSGLSPGQYYLNSMPYMTKVETYFYSFSTIEAIINVTLDKYHVTLKAGDNGGVYLSSQPGDSYVFGNILTFTSFSGTGYEVDEWIVTDASGNIDFSQTGGETFTFRTPSHDTYVSVSFKQKDIRLTFSSDPSYAGSVEATDGNGNPISNDALVLEGSPVTITVTPADHYYFGIWRIYAGGPNPAELQGNVDPDTGVVTLSFNMPSFSTHIEAVMAPEKYMITLGDGLTAWYMFDDDNNPGTPDVKVTVTSGDRVEYNTELTVEAKSGLYITEWTNYPATAVFASDDQSCTYVVDDDAVFEASSGVYYTLTVDAVTGGKIEVTIGGNLSLEDFSAGVLILADTQVSLKVILDYPSTYTAGFWTINGVQSFYGRESIILAINEDTEVSLDLKMSLASSAIYFNDTLMACVDENDNPVNSSDTVVPGTELTFSVLSLASDKRVSEWLTGPNASSLSFTQSGGDTFTFTMPGTDTYVSVTIEDITITVTVINGNKGTYSLDCGSGINSDAVPFGSNVALYVTPDTGYNVKVVLSDGVNADMELIADISGGVWGYDISDLRSDITLTISYLSDAVFNITLNKTGLTGGDFSASAGTAKEGDVITLTASADGGYIFSYWTVVESISGKTVQLTGDEFVMPAADVTVSAYFITAPLETYALTVVSGTDLTGSGLYTAGTRVIITADTAPSGKTFDSWTGGNGGTFGNTGNQTTYFIMPASNTTVTATYKTVVSPSTPSTPTTPPASTYVSVTGITMLTKDSGTLNVGDSLRLNASVTPSNATNPAVSWSSSNPFVASVDSMGVVSAHEGGTVTITVMAHEGGYAATYVVTVAEETGSSLSAGNNSIVWALVVLVIALVIICVIAMIMMYRMKVAGGRRS